MAVGWSRRRARGAQGADQPLPPTPATTPPAWRRSTGKPPPASTRRAARGNPFTRSSSTSATGPPRRPPTPPLRPWSRPRPSRTCPRAGWPCRRRRGRGGKRWRRRPSLCTRSRTSSSSAATTRATSSRPPPCGRGTGWRGGTCFRRGVRGRGRGWAGQTMGEREAGAGAVVSPEALPFIPRPDAITGAGEQGGSGESGKARARGRHPPSPILSALLSQRLLSISHQRPRASSFSASSNSFVTRSSLFLGSGTSAPNELMWPATALRALYVLP